MRHVEKVRREVMINKQRYDYMLRKCTPGESLSSTVLMEKHKEGQRSSTLSFWI